MSRQARQQSITDVYHVIQRGIDRTDIFYDDDDRQMFLNLMRLQACESFKIYSYCLMDNHIHLLVKSDRLSFHIHHIASIYAAWFNHKHERRGYLFQDRFKSEVVEDEGYFLRCFRYILQNPLKAGLCKTVSTYRWNSYSAYYPSRDPLISTEFLPIFFDQQEDFETYLGEKDDGEYMDIDSSYKMTDSEVRRLLKEKLGNRQPIAVSFSELKQVLKELKQHPSISQHQLARIAGVSFYTIRNL